MPVSFKILPDRALAYVRFEGVITVPEASAAFADYAADPEMRPDQRHLLDMSRVTGWTTDFPALFELHASQLDVLMTAQHEILWVYFAPAEPARSLVQLAVRSWGEVPGLIVTLEENEAGALEILGLRENTIEALLQAS